MENLVQNALDDLESIILIIPQGWRSFQRVKDWGSFARVKDLKHLLESVKVFYSCGRKRCEDKGWKSALCKLEETINKGSLKILFLFLTLKEKIIDNQLTFNERWDYIIYKVHKEIAVSIEIEIRKIDIHREISDFSLPTISSSRIDVKQQLDSIDCIVYRLQSFHHPLQKEVKAIRFMKNFILFAMHHGLEGGQMGNLLIHIEDVLVHAAYLVLKASSFNNNLYPHPCQEVMLRKIEPVELSVCDIYVGVLREIVKLSGSWSRLARESHNLNHIYAGFVESLIFLLLILFFSGRTSFMDNFGHQMQYLHEGLAFLRTTLLRELHGEVDELHKRIHDIVGPSICEAGIIVFSLFLENEDKDSLVQKLELHFSVFEENIKLSKVIEGGMPRYPLKFAYPQTNLMGFIDSVLEKLNSVMNHKAGSVVASEKDKFTYVYVGLRFIRSFMVDDIGQQDHNGKLKDLWSCVVAVVYETEFILDSLVVGDPLQSLVPLDLVIAEIEHIKTKVLQTSQSMKRTIEFQKITKDNRKTPSIDKIQDFNEPVVGLDDEEEIIIDRLTRGTEHLEVVSIVGMAGLGKTTLAKKVYHHLSIFHHFAVRSWCTVSQLYNKKNVLLEILSSLDKNISGEYSEISENDLANTLYKRLKRRRYLIILDDVWDTQAWSSMAISFPDDGQGSRILLTSRHENVALQIEPNSKPHHLRALTDEESLVLFQKKICFKEGPHSDLLARGKPIAQYCKGLPLMILIVAGFLANADPGKWEEVEEILKKDSTIVANQCRDTLELSYRYLPNHLKSCFLYCGAFKEDKKILLRELSWLWIAEGFVEETETECLEDIAVGYMRELIQRNLVMVAEKGPRGNVESCVLHDLLHDFAIAKSKEEHFMYHIHGQDLNIPVEHNMLYRLTANSVGMEEFPDSTLFCPRLRTLLFATESERFTPSQPSYSSLYNFCLSKLIRVLDLTNLCGFDSFPCLILLLVHLKYLAFANSYSSIIIPSTIVNLSDLETLIIKNADIVQLPDTLWIMKKLRHLEGALSWILPSEIVDPVFNLENLLTLSCVLFSSCQTMMESLKKLPNLHRLDCVLDLNGDHIMDLMTLSQLESLYVDCEGIPTKFQFPENLKMLTLRSCQLPWSEISAIDISLPNLEALILRGSMIGENWDLEEEEGTFSKLRFLELRCKKLFKWTTTEDDSFRSLETLVLRGCSELEQLPSCLTQSPTLKKIQVIDCPNVLNSIKEIHEMQMDFGNEDLKIYINGHQLTNE